MRFRGKRYGLRLIFILITSKTPALARVSGQFCSKRLVDAGVLVLVKRKWCLIPVALSGTEWY